MQSEFRNLKMHLICVTLRLQSLSPKIRSTMSILCSRVSLDDFQLKVRNLLRNSEFRDIITELPKGEFVFPELDLKLTTEPFKQNGLPYEVKLQIEQVQPQKKIGFFRALWNWEKLNYESGQRKYQANHPEKALFTEKENSEEDEELDDMLILNPLSEEEDP
jgi:uncharacterized protein (DUF2225 family)